MAVTMFRGGSRSWGSCSRFCGVRLQNIGKVLLGMEVQVRSSPYRIVEANVTNAFGYAEAI